MFGTSQAVIALLRTTLFITLQNWDILLRIEI
jgi:hypothetical protein